MKAPMRVEALIFTVLFVFFLVVGPAYFLITHEVIGTMALVLACATGGFIAFYLFKTGTHIAPRPEDDKEGEIVDGTGPLGFFPPKSVWPLAVAATIAIMLLGPVFGWWITLIGIGIGIWSTSGWVYEFYRGDYQH